MKQQNEKAEDATANLTQQILEILGEPKPPDPLEGSPLVRLTNDQLGRLRRLNQLIGPDPIIRLAPHLK